MTMSMNTERHPICHKAIVHFGAPHQKIKAVEELSELAKELVKNYEGAHNRDRVIEEMADVHIMLVQLAEIFSAGDDLERMIAFKLDRLKMRMEREK